MRYMSFFFSSRRRHTTCGRDWSSDVCSSDLCVGSKTRQLLEKNGFKVLETKEYAENLVPIIQQKFSKKHIAFRSEERRVGKECRSRCVRYNSIKNVNNNNDYVYELWCVRLRD